MSLGGGGQPGDSSPNAFVPEGQGQGPRVAAAHCPHWWEVGGRAAFSFSTSRGGPRWVRSGATSAGHAWAIRRGVLARAQDVQLAASQPSSVYLQLPLPTTPCTHGWSCRPGATCPLPL